MAQQRGGDMNPFFHNLAPLFSEEKSNIQYIQG